MWKEDMSEKEKKKLDQELKAYQESLPFHLQMKLSRSHIPYVSQAILDRMPDEAIVYSLGTTIYMYQNDRPNPKFDKLRKCDACGKTERAMKEFKVCGGCKSVSYVLLWSLRMLLLSYHSLLVRSLIHIPRKYSNAKHHTRTLHDRTQVLLQQMSERCLERY